MSTDNFKAEEMLSRADLLIKENKISDAMQLLYDIIADYPDFGKAYNHIGWIYETKIADMQKAEEHYKLALKYNPAYTAVYYNYAILLSTLQRYDELKKLLETAMKVPGINRGTIHNEFAIMYETQGKYEEAISSYKEYVRSLYDSTLIEKAAESLKRCQRKKEILGN